MSLLYLNLALKLTFAHALLTTFKEEPWGLERIRIRVDGQTGLEYAKCGREYFPIRNFFVANCKNIRVRVDGA